MESVRRYSLSLRLAFLVILLIVTSAGPGKRAAAASDNDFYTEPFVVSGLNTHTAAINQIDADAGAKFLVTGSSDKSIRVWSRENGRLLQVIRVAAGPGFIGRIYATALSPNGALIAAGGFTDGRSSVSHIYLFDRETGRQTGLIGELPGVVNQLAFSPDGTKLAAVLGGKNGIRLFDVGDWHQIGSDSNYSESSQGVAFSADGMVATTAFDGKIRLYSPDLRRLLVGTAPGGNSPLGVAFQPRGSLLAVGYYGTPRVDLIDAATLTPVQSANISGVSNGDLSRVAWSSDGARLFAAGSWQRDGQVPVRAWSRNGKDILADYAAAENTITSLKALPDGRLAIASGDPRITLLDRTGAKAWVTNPEMADYREQQNSLLVSADAARVQLRFDSTGHGTARFDLHKRQLDINPPADSSLRPATTDGLSAVWLNTTAPSLDGRLIPLDAHEMSRALAVAPDRQDIVLGAEWSLRRLSRDGTVVWQIQTPGVTWAVNIPSDGRTVVAAFSDGTIRWYRLSDGAELLAFFPRRDAELWVAWSASGYYIAPPGGEELIQWQINHGGSVAPEVISAAHFRSQFYRPDVVEQVLAKLDPTSALAVADKQASRQTVVPDVANETPPVIKIVDPGDNSVLDTDDITVAYKLTGRPGMQIRQIRLMVDGQLVATQENVVVPDTGLVSSELRGRLPEKAELLTLVAETSNGRSDPAKVQIRRSKSRLNTKSKLYVLAVGIGKFQDKMVPTLQYAGNDAADFVIRMEAQKGGLYDQVLVQSLVDSKATKQAILDGLFSLERQMQPSDVAAIFISTHGQNDAAGKFYLIPYNANVSDDSWVRQTAVRYDDLRDTLTRLADRGKTLVFLDACHSGNIIPGAKSLGTDVDGIAADLASSESGVIVFSSSTGRQISLERPEFSHGVFTYALLEAFDGKASREPPWLRISDLSFWLGKEVSRLTDGAQTPRTAAPTERMIDPRIFRTTRVQQ